MQVIEKQLRLKPDEILVTRSGSIGRVIYVTKRFEGIIASDDFVKIRISDENLRYFIYYYLRSKAGQDQMKRDEYGSIQQHLEAAHIKKLLVPLPDNLDEINKVIEMGRKAISMQEAAYEIDMNTNRNINELLTRFDIV